MKSKHSLWQARWDVDQLAGVAVHDSGLRVRLDGEQGLADNAGAVELALAALHGAHNAAAMVQLLTRQGRQLLIDPHSRGWRGG